MDIDMEASPSSFDPNDLSIREQFRRYGKRHTSLSNSPHPETPSSSSKILFDGNNIQIRPNAALFLEEIKQEVENFESDGGTHQSSIKQLKRRSSMEDDFAGFDNSSRRTSSPLKSCKIDEDDVLSADGVESTFALFASLLDSSLQENEELPQDLLLFPTTSHLEACQFVMNDHTAELCLRIVQWLEGLASKALDLENKVRGCYVGSYLPSSGVWHNTQRLLKRGHAAAATVQHLDFDAPTRELAQQHPDDKKQDESLLEDIWTLLRAGRLDEACELCRAAGQPWRAATLRPFGGLNLFPSVEALLKNGKSRVLQAIELESGIGRQWCLWKWASYNASEKIADQEAGKYEAAIYAAQCSNLKRLLPICTDWESACWAIAKSWLDVQIDLELSRFQPGRLENLQSDEEEIDQSPGHGDEALQSVGTESWPRHVLRQQPRDLSALFQKLHSGDIVHDSVSRGCKEQHRQIEMNLMVGDIPHLLDLLWSWISPSEEYNEFRAHGDPQMIRFGAHLVLVLRYLVAGQIKDAFREKLLTVGDLILHMYAMFLFSKQHEELVGVYASQLARHRCIDLFVYMMELRLEWRVSVKYKIFQSAMEYLPFSPEDDSKGSFEEIIDRVLSRSRETKPRKYDEKSLDVAEQHRWQSLQKAMVVQWLCFTPPSTINNAELIKAKLLLKALVHSNTLFREFALISMWRIPKMPKGAHMLLSYLAEPLKQPTDNLFKSFDEFHDSSESLDEFQDWREYYSCDATYRNWLKIEMENEQDSLVSLEERQRAIGAAKETLDSSMLLLQREEFPWMVYVDDPIYESEDPTYLELHATAMLSLPSGECMCPDYALCTALTSALYSSVSEDVVSNRELMVNVSISTTDNYCVEVVLRCMAIEGDGLGRHELNDGGVLATLMATGFKGELVQFRAGVIMEISRLDAWYSNKDGILERPAAYIVRGLCRRCCLPEIILRCMQVSVSLVESGNPPECHDELIDIVASSENGYLHLFSQHQLQEFLLFEREYSIFKMELEAGPLEEDS
ncbi:hypothetical protein AQUCO_02000426v1 [Aquilegia coerulea]|uniref:Nuclear pore complex protein n=1 Tax=Aquilegia coerulea TaxID=218851 RepID=A0A2G5DHM2_AQUCA|nr:hypothetical protein AQUCO_02000426v1 [Aquilegia coerulea]